MRWFWLVVFGALGCSSDVDVTRSVTVSAERLAAIQTQPYARRFRSGRTPAARLAGLGDDPWPESILFLDYGVYLHELGFGDRMALQAIDGVRVHRIFESRWQNRAVGRPGAFHREHYTDLIRYLFDARPGGRRTITVLREVPYSASDIGAYTPKLERWAIEFTPE